MIVKLNVNETVWVKLTPRGQEIYKEHWRSLGIRIMTKEGKDTDAEGWSQFQLWDLMSLFGPYLYNGGAVPFETEIEIRKPL